MSPQLFTSLYGISRWLFAFFALFLFFFAFSWLRAERKKHRDRFRSLPGAGTVGEMVVLSGSSQLPENTWFIEDLLGCKVVEDGTDTVYGSITDVQKYPANDVWTVNEPSGKEVLVPAIKDVVVSADIENKTVYIKALKGLFSGEESVREDED